jgi:bidirectional [NiFe] hydrogenase diaphorase subunit
MNDITLEIDGKTVTVPEGTTILEAAGANGIRIPTLCHNEKLKPQGVCRMCMVEITKGSRTRLVASCVYPVQEGLVVKTATERILKIRRMILELTWPSTHFLGKELGVSSSRFATQETECSLCGLCLRYCTEVKKKNVLYFKGRGINRKLAFIPGGKDECAYCEECFPLCTGGLVVNKVLEL